MKLLAWEGDLKLAGECDCGKKYVTPENKVREATEDDVRAWCFDHGFEMVREDRGRDEA